MKARLIILLGLALVLEGTAAAQVRFYMLGKGLWYEQNDILTPAEPIDYEAAGIVIPDNDDQVENVELVTLPGETDPFYWQSSLPDHPSYWWLEASWWGGDYYSDTNDLNDAVPPGDYRMTITLTNGSLTNVLLTMPADSYPNTPHIVNYNAAQQINPYQDFVLRWDAFVNGTTNDHVRVVIWDEFFNELAYQSPKPGEPGALNGLSNSVVIPAYTLTNSEFKANLIFFKATSVDRTNFPGGLGLVGYYKQTSFYLHTPDVTAYSVLKGQVYSQTNSGPPVLQTNHPFEFQARVEKSEYSDGLSDAHLRTPDFTSIENFYTDYAGYLYGNFPSLGELDFSYSDGTYLFTIWTANDEPSPTYANLSLTNGLYPTTPQITNYIAAQTIDGRQDFTLSWDTFAGGTTNDYIAVRIWTTNSFGDEQSIVGTADYGRAGALNGTNKSIVIRSNTLKAGQTCNGELVFGKLAHVNRTDYLGALGYAGYYKLTRFQIHATNGLPAVDLAATELNFTGNPAAGSANQTIQVTYTVANLGNITATNDRLYRLTLSEDPYDPYVNYSVLDDCSAGDPMPAGGTTNRAFSVLLPSYPAGNYYLHLLIEYEGEESNLTDNQRSVPITFAVDATAPTSAVQPLPLYVQPVFTVSWQGTDEPGGSGIQDYTIYVSDNGAASNIWKLNTTATSASYTGVAEHTYNFYSVARDNAGNVENPAAGPVSTTVSTNFFSLTFNLAKGYNLVSVPFEGTGLTNALQLIQTITNCEAAWYWDAGIQNWRGRTLLGGTNFPLQAGGAYLVSVTATSSFSPSGLWAAPVFALKRGYNLISVPNTKPGITNALALINSIANCEAAWFWDASIQNWRGRTLLGGTNFAVEVGWPYLISETADASW